MRIPYRTRRLINRIGFVSTIILMVLAIFWFCWVIFVERYVVYTRDGAILDLEHSANDIIGEVAMPPQSSQGISIYYNEGANSIELGNQMTQLNGYYISVDALINDIAGVWEDLEKLPAGSTVMIDLKSGTGVFYYTSALTNATKSTQVSTASVDEMIKYMQQRGFYTIARISSLRDRSYGLVNVPDGLYMTNRKGLWADSGGCYWLNPTDNDVVNWIGSIVLELKALGFREVVLRDFAFPNTDNIIFNGDKTAALQTCAKELMRICGSDTFTLSFGVSSASFQLPEGRCRMYLENVPATDVGARVSQSGLEEPEIYIVFVAETNDTRYDDYGVLRPIAVAEVLEAQKAEREEAEEDQASDRGD